MIKIIVNGQSLSAECKKLASDSVDYLSCSFCFSSDWYGLTKTAQFTQNGRTLNVLVENDTCPVPAEITVGKAELSVFGVQAGGTKRITTLPVTIELISSGFVTDGDTPVPPTPDLYSQLLKRVEDTVEALPKKLSEFTNDKGFVTEEALPKKLSELTNDKGFVTEEALPKKLSELTNDTAFATEDYVLGLVGDIEGVLDGIIASQERFIAIGKSYGDTYLKQSGGAAV